MIPKTFFYYWTGQCFQYVHYLSVLSLLRLCDPDRIEVYVEEEPTNNSYWNKVSTLKSVRIVPVNFQDLISLAGLSYEDFTPFLHLAKTVHKSDFIRYLLLAAYGGTYLDFDTLMVRDLRSLLDVNFFVGKQGSDMWGNSINGAVMGSKRNSSEIRECLMRIKNLRQVTKIGSLKDLEVLLNGLFLPRHYRWAETGPSLLTKYVQSRMGSVVAYPREYFQYWHHSDWQKIFSPGSIPEEAYGIHFFGQGSAGFTKNINENYVHTSNSIYAQAARSILTAD